MLLLQDVPGERQGLLAAVLLVLVVGALETQPYLLWRSRMVSADQGLPPAGPDGTKVP